jgi:hypothetical protein
MIYHIVDRLHVGESNLAACCAVFRKIRKAARRDPKLTATRKAAFKMAIERHEANRNLFNFVMRGR